MKRKKKLRKKKCKIENVNNFSFRLKIEMTIFIISPKIYYIDFYYILSNGDIEHIVNGVYILGLYCLSKKKTYFISFMNFNHFDES